MSFEIELKAHINESQVNEIVSILKSAKTSTYLGDIDKKDIYWALPGTDKPYFRTRYERTNDKSSVLITSKPLKKKDYSVEYNVENEFIASADQWDNIINFCNGLNLEIIRIKYKTGVHFIVKVSDFSIHCEILNVKHLGWFIESEIISEAEDIDKSGAENALYSLLDFVNVSRDSIEPRGYNKLLKEAGHEKG